MSLTVNSKEDRDGVFRVIPVGSLDSNTYAILEKKIDSLLAIKPSAIVFDFEQLNYISSAGIRVVVKAKKAMKARGGSVAFMNFQPQIKKVFDIINMLPSMNLFTSVREMDNYLDKMQKAPVDPNSESDSEY